MWRILQQDEPDDYVLATGETHTVREFVELAFHQIGRPIAWRGEGDDEQGCCRRTGRVLVAIDGSYRRPTEVDLLLGDPAKALSQARLAASHELSGAGRRDGGSRSPGDEEHGSQEWPTSPSYTLRNKRVWVAGDRGLVGSALVRRLQREGCEILTAPRESRRPAPARPGRALDGRGQAAGGVPRRGARRRHLRQRHAAGRVHLRQPDDPEQRRRGFATRRRREADASGLVLHLSAPGAAADPRGGAAHRAARADQPMVCGGQDRRHQARPGLSPAVWLRLHLRHADQSLRSRATISTSCRATSCRR